MGVQQALRNYERFHNLPKGTATIQQVISSSAGINGWEQTEAARESPQSPIPTASTIEAVTSDLSGLAGMDGRLQPGAWRMSEDIQDALDVQGISDELIAYWTQSERQVLMPKSKQADAQAALPVDVRRTSLSFLCTILVSANLGHDCWFHAATLLDMFLFHSTDAKPIDALPATCAALVLLLKKMDTAITCMRGSSFSRPATQFAQHLISLGYHTVHPEVTEEMVDLQEQKILQALDWRLRFPTPESWTAMFTARFNVLTHNFLMPSLNWVCQRSLLAARHTIMRQALPVELPPKALTVGLFGINLVGARLLPLEAIKPPKLSDDDWVLLYKSSTMSQQIECVLAAADSSKLLELFLVTVGACLADVQEYCHLAAMAMLDAVCDAPDSSGHHGSRGAYASI
jgi:hypothetical protein